MDKEAQGNLILLRRAENIFRIEVGTYYPSAGSISDIAAINTNLGLILPTAANRSWDYEVWSTGCSRATRNGGNLRSWYITINDADDKPNAGAGCP